MEWNQTIEQDLLSWMQQAPDRASSDKKLKYLERLMKKYPTLATQTIKQILAELTREEKIVVYSILLIGQGNLLEDKETKQAVCEFIQPLLEVEAFYGAIGGVIGYHVTCLRLLEKKEKKESKGTYHAPIPIDIGQQTEAVEQYIWAALKQLDQVGEMYPIGGAADRLGAKDPNTGRCSSAAPFNFCGKTLIERLICDLQAREFLYFKLFGKQIFTPIAMMTSFEKNNNQDVTSLFESKQWFGRREQDLFLFSQPLVPLMNQKGVWKLNERKQLQLKPGGHGVIWKLSSEKGVLDAFKKRKIKKILTRQINNLASGIDYGLLAFMGVGLAHRKEIGFASCPRKEGMSEGVNVVIENQEGLCLTNIEYCDLVHFQADFEEKEAYFANTNILFFDLRAIERLIQKNPIPGMLVNAKKVVAEGKNERGEEELLRLESTMQNLADALVESTLFPSQMKKSYLTVNHRMKTISTIKKEFLFGSSVLQTPEQCLIDLLENSYDLLVNYCGFTVPELEYGTTLFTEGPSFFFVYHPAIGPLYSVIRQKLRQGILTHRSVLCLEIAEVFLDRVVIDGALTIQAKTPLGSVDDSGVIYYNDKAGKCFLKDVIVKNQGKSVGSITQLWKEPLALEERCLIEIEEGGELYAQGICLEGSISIVVPKNTRLVISQQAGVLDFQYTSLASTERIVWQYLANEEKEIEVTIAIPEELATQLQGCHC